MNYSAILKSDIANSADGFSVTLFVSGCARHCDGCFNKKTWDCNYGKKFDDDARRKIFAELEKPHCRCFSIVGGEPLSILSDNRRTVIDIAREVREKFPNKKIYVWSGYTIEEILADISMKNILDYIDVLVDGPFIKELKDTTLALRGSSNQRILDISEFRKTGKIVQIAEG